MRSGCVLWLLFFTIAIKVEAWKGVDESSEHHADQSDEDTQDDEPHKSDIQENSNLKKVEKDLDQKKDDYDYYYYDGKDDYDHDDDVYHYHHYDHNYDDEEEKHKAKRKTKEGGGEGVDKHASETTTSQVVAKRKHRSSKMSHLKTRIVAATSETSQMNRAFASTVKGSRMSKRKHKKRRKISSHSTAKLNHTEEPTHTKILTVTPHSTEVSENQEATKTYHFEARELSLSHAKSSIGYSKSRIATNIKSRHSKKKIKRVAPGRNVTSEYPTTHSDVTPLQVDDKTKSQQNVTTVSATRRIDVTETVSNTNTPSSLEINVTPALVIPKDTHDDHSAEKDISVSSSTTRIVLKDEISSKGTVTPTSTTGEQHSNERNLSVFDTLKYFYVKRKKEKTTTENPPETVTVANSVVTTNSLAVESSTTEENNDHLSTNDVHKLKSTNPVKCRSPKETTQSTDVVSETTKPATSASAETVYKSSVKEDKNSHLSTTSSSTYPVKHTCHKETTHSINAVYETTKPARSSSTEGVYESSVKEDNRNYLSTNDVHTFTSRYPVKYRSGKETTHSTDGTSETTKPAGSASAEMVYKSSVKEENDDRLSAIDVHTFTRRYPVKYRSGEETTHSSDAVSETTKPAGSASTETADKSSVKEEDNDHLNNYDVHTFTMRYPVKYRSGKETTHSTDGTSETTKPAGSASAEMVYKASVKEENDDRLNVHTFTTRYPVEYRSGEETTHSSDAVSETTKPAGSASTETADKSSVKEEDNDHLNNYDVRTFTRRYPLKSRSGKQTTHSTDAVSETTKPAGSPSSETVYKSSAKEENSDHLNVEDVHTFTRRYPLKYRSGKETTHSTDAVSETTKPAGSPSTEIVYKSSVKEEKHDHLNIDDVHKFTRKYPVKYRSGKETTHSTDGTSETTKPAGSPSTEFVYKSFVKEEKNDHLNIDDVHKFTRKYPVKYRSGKETTHASNAVSETTKPAGTPSTETVYISSVKEENKAHLNSNDVHTFTRKYPVIMETTHSSNAVSETTKPAGSPSTETVYKSSVKEEKNDHLNIEDVHTFIRRYPLKYRPRKETTHSTDAISETIKPAGSPSTETVYKSSVKEENNDHLNTDDVHTFTRKYSVKYRSGKETTHSTDAVSQTTRPAGTPSTETVYKFSVKEEKNDHLNIEDVYTFIRRYPVKYRSREESTHSSNAISETTTPAGSASTETVYKSFVQEEKNDHLNIEDVHTFIRKYPLKYRSRKETTHSTDAVSETTKPAESPSTETVYRPSVKEENYDHLNAEDVHTFKRQYPLKSGKEATHSNDAVSETTKSTYTTSTVRYTTEKSSSTVISSTPIPTTTVASIPTEELRTITSSPNEAVPEDTAIAPLKSNHGFTESMVSPEAPGVSEATIIVDSAFVTEIDSENKLQKEAESDTISFTTDRIQKYEVETSHFRTYAPIPEPVKYDPYIFSRLKRKRKSNSNLSHRRWLSLTY